MGHFVVGVLDGFEAVALVLRMLARAATPGRTVGGDRGLGKPLGRRWHRGVLRVATEQRLEFRDTLAERVGCGVQPGELGLLFEQKAAQTRDLVLVVIICEGRHPSDFSFIQAVTRGEPGGGFQRGEQLQPREIQSVEDAIEGTLQWQKLVRGN